MSLLFARAAVVPFWMIAVALIAVLGPPGGPGLRDLLNLLGLTLVASAFLALVASAVRALGPASRTRHAPVIETQRQLVRRGMALWNRTEAQHALAPIGQPWPDYSTRGSAASKLAADVTATAQTQLGPAE